VIEKKVSNIYHKPVKKTPKDHIVNVMEENKNPDQVVIS
jgi:hypothetical protein